MPSDKFATGGSMLACQLMDALGIDYKRHPVKSITLRMAGGDIIEVDIVRYVREREAADIAEVLEHYKLVPKE